MAAMTPGQGQTETLTLRVKSRDGQIYSTSKKITAVAAPKKVACHPHPKTLSERIKKRELSAHITQPSGAHHARQQQTF
jgi:hypothetical protein